MPTKINCQYNDDGAWCKCTSVKRSLFGIGARCCVEYPPNEKVCEFKNPYPRPTNLPPAPPIPSIK